MKYLPPLLIFSLAFMSQLANSSDVAATPEAQIKAVLTSQETAWNKGDLDGFLVGYWNSPKVVFQSGGDRSDGFAAMRDRYHKNYKADGKEMGTLKFDGIEIDLLGPDAAMARGAWALTKTDGSNPKGLFTLILKKLPEGWRIVHDHTSVAVPKKP